MTSQRTPKGRPRKAQRSGRSSNSFSRTREDHAAEIDEDYVEMIDQLIRELGQARLVDLAERMGVTHVTANRRVARLLEAGLIRKDAYKPIFLTPKGAAMASACRRRHDTVYRFLRAIGVPEEDARLDSEGIEHHAGDATILAMSRFLQSRR